MVGKYVDIMGISCDSFVEDVNMKIGRCSNDNPQQV